MRINAANHAGWEVQVLTRKGWVNVLNQLNNKPDIFDTIEEAQCEMKSLSNCTMHHVELRVYEALL